MPISEKDMLEQAAITALKDEYGRTKEVYRTQVVNTSTNNSIMDKWEEAPTAKQKQIYELTSIETIPETLKHQPFNHITEEDSLFSQSIEERKKQGSVKVLKTDSFFNKLPMHFMAHNPIMMKKSKNEHTKSSLNTLQEVVWKTRLALKSREASMFSKNSSNSRDLTTYNSHHMRDVP